MREFLREFGPARRLWYEWRIRRCPPVFVFQMGKVGSYALHRALFKWWPGVVVHRHHLWDRFDDAAIRAIERSCFGGKRPVYLISLAREPIARNVSDFFETYEWYFGTSITERNETVPELQETFLSEHRHSVPLVWFDERLRPVTGIDVYASTFPPRGYQEYHRENIHLLVMRTDLENKTKSEVVKKFLPDRAEGVPSVERKNSANDKPYQELYGEFKAQFIPPKWYLEYMYNSRYARHFFTEDELTFFRKRWSGPRTAML